VYLARRHARFLRRPERLQDGTAASRRWGRMGLGLIGCSGGCGLLPRLSRQPSLLPLTALSFSVARCFPILLLPLWSCRDVAPSSFPLTLLQARHCDSTPDLDGLFCRPALSPTTAPAHRPGSPTLYNPTSHPPRLAISLRSAHSLCTFEQRLADRLITLSAPY
jgi:hypothetical protein